MKKTTFILILVAIFTSCGQNTKKADSSTNSLSENSSLSADSNIVNVYYFHGKQRCKTCIAVGNIAKQTVEITFADNENVRFTEINTSEKANEALCEKYEVSWNALIIVKGENAVDITEQAFATAIENPQKLEELIKQEVNKRTK